MDPRWTGERDCRGLRTILHGGEGAGEKTLDCTVIQSFNFGSVEYFSRDIFVKRRLK